MSGWPSLDRADDERLARALAAGDPGALIQVMDRYAARLYDYCHALLRDQELAAGALHDALIAAYAHVPALREPEWFRAWLYTLVRGECLRRLRDPDRPAGRHEAPEVEDGFVDEAERARRQEARQLVHGALAGLRGRERESLDLVLRHGLDPLEVSGVLGMDGQEATALVAEARARLDDALAVAFVARTGRGDCPDLAALVGDAPWPLPPPLAARVAEHIGRCPVCHVRRERLSAPRLLQVLPVAMMPTDLRGLVLATATDPALAADLGAIAHRAGPFDDRGWPMAAGETAPPEEPSRRTPRALWPALAAAAAVVLIVAGAFFLMPDSSKKPTSATGPGGSLSASVDDPSESPSESEEPSDSPTPTESGTPTPTPTTPSPTTPTPTRTPTRHPSSRPPRSTPTQSRPGTLSASGCAIAGPGGSCTVTLTASGGPVNWHVASHSPFLSVSPGGGRVPAGGSRPVTVTLNGGCPPGGGTGSVSFSPGGAASITLTCPEQG
ncbi:sigma-70 family RNA polymerase sigma factor [Actinomadura litoris]|uniref:Sigma-70 family RNA polymerase sigma factor n=1 Tax=Actinomadura litoris TaxID=2678616 RepID=A0A7K1L2E4_9ACTN|nr:sigma-70 family RNA polymerase sigma factor [Actinomadura litoris]MUN38557.1 sigma-70 family RNA polymerase sigma factor [Actinomadura litoris]